MMNGRARRRRNTQPQGFILLVSLSFFSLFPSEGSAAAWRRHETKAQKSKVRTVRTAGVPLLGPREGGSPVKPVKNERRFARIPHPRPKSRRRNKLEKAPLTRHSLTYSSGTSPSRYKRGVPSLLPPLTLSCLSVLIPARPRFCESCACLVYASIASPSSVNTLRYCTWQGRPPSVGPPPG